MQILKKNRVCGKISFFSRIGNELITAESVCNGNEATPNIPPAEFGYIFGWSAALFSSNMEKVKKSENGPIIKKFESALQATYVVLTDLSIFQKAVTFNHKLFNLFFSNTFLSVYTF